MDTSLTGGRKKGAAIDAYVKVKFNGYKAKTEVVASQSPAWNTEFWFPILVPSVGAKALVYIMDQV